MLPITNNRPFWQSGVNVAPFANGFAEAMQVVSRDICLVDWSLAFVARDEEDVLRVVNPRELIHPPIEGNALFEIAGTRVRFLD